MTDLSQRSTTDFPDDHLTIGAGRLALGVADRSCPISLWLGEQWRQPYRRVGRPLTKHSSIWCIPSQLQCKYSSVGVYVCLFRSLELRNTRSQGAVLSSNLAVMNSRVQRPVKLGMNITQMVMLMIQMLRILRRTGREIGSQVLVPKLRI